MPGGSLRARKIADDPVILDAKHYKVLIDNDRVRVLQVNYGQGEKSPMHSHPDSLAIFLADQKARFGLPNGKSEEREMRAGQVQWSPAETHAPENVGNAPLKLVLVELKPPARAREARPADTQDPVVLDPEHNQVLIDNDRVRAVRIAYPPGGKAKMHGHPAHVVVLLNDSKIKFETPSGKSETMEGKAGDVHWADANVHTSENVGDEGYEVVVVELKGKAGPRIVK